MFESPEKYQDKSNKKPEEKKEEDRKEEGKKEERGQKIMKKRDFLFIEDIWGGGHLSLQFLPKSGKFKWIAGATDGGSSIAELEPEECKKWLRDDYSLKHTPGKIQEALNFVESCIRQHD